MIKPKVTNDPPSHHEPVKAQSWTAVALDFVIVVWGFVFKYPRLSGKMKGAI